MSRTEIPRSRLWQLILLSTFVAACNGDNNGRDPIFGIDDPIAAVSSTVTAVAPGYSATGIAVNNTVINATFSEPMVPLNAENFIVTCDALSMNSSGTVALDANATAATYTTRYTGTIVGATSLASGREMAGSFVW